MLPPPRILLANPRGFCAGVDRAIAICQHALEQLGPPLYVRHAIVHNQTVVSALESQGVVFVEDLKAIPKGNTVIFSAHGVPPSVRAEAAQRNLKILDATCPLVTKVHLEVARLSRLGYECILIGHAGHPEVTGSLGHYDCPHGDIYLVENEQVARTLRIKNAAALGYVTQTTLSVKNTAQIIAILKQRFPRIKGPGKDDICYATHHRQQAVLRLADLSDLVLIVGSEESSNAKRLRELAQHLGKSAWLIDSAADLQRTWLQGVSCIGVTASASAPEHRVQEIIGQLQHWGAGPVTELPGPVETLSFSLPPELRTAV